MKFFGRLMLIGTLLLSHSVYAKIPLSCEQHYRSDWTDYTDIRSSVSILTLAGTERTDQSGTLITILRSAEGNIRFEGFDATCTKQADGSLNIILKIDHRYGSVYLNMVTYDGVTLNVRPGSYVRLRMLPKDDAYEEEVKGPFVLTWQDS